MNHAEFNFKDSIWSQFKVQSREVKFNQVLGLNPKYKRAMNFSII